MKRSTLMARTLTPSRTLTIAACLMTLALAAEPSLASPQNNAQRAAHAAENTDGQWLKHAAEGSNAEIMMPVKPRLTERTFRPVADEPFINVKNWLCTANSGQVLFKLSYHDLHQRPETRQQIQQTLDGAVKGAVAQVVGRSDVVKNAKVRTYPGRKFTFEFNFNGQEYKSDAEVYLIGKRQYMLTTIFELPHYKPELSQKFFETFNPFDPEDSALASGVDGDASNSQPAAGGAFDGLSLPAGEQPIELK